ncbi:hypothetical protein D0T50_08815 [Bacteroides sp. 214]|nr:hypothetical protein [Bacteroides sp. 214]
MHIQHQLTKFINKRNISRSPAEQPPQTTQNTTYNKTKHIKQLQKKLFTTFHANKLIILFIISNIVVSLQYRIRKRQFINALNL